MSDSENGEYDDDARVHTGITDEEGSAIARENRIMIEYLQRDAIARATELQGQRALLVQLLQATRPAGALVQDYDDQLLKAAKKILIVHGDFQTPAKMWNLVKPAGMPNDLALQQTFSAPDIALYMAKLYVDGEKHLKFSAKDLEKDYESKKDEIYEEDQQRMEEELEAAQEKADEIARAAGSSKPAATKPKTRAAPKPAEKSAPARKPRGAAASEAAPMSDKAKGKQRAVEESQDEADVEDYDAKDVAGDQEMEEDRQQPKKKSLTREERRLARELNKDQHS